MFYKFIIQGCNYFGNFYPIYWLLYFNSGKYELVLFTTKNSNLAQKWLRNNNIDCYFGEITNIKKPASIYIDDRAINFNGNFNKTLDEVEKFTVYWKKK